MNNSVLIFIKNLLTLFVFIMLFGGGKGGGLKTICSIVSGTTLVSGLNSLDELVTAKSPSLPAVCSYFAAVL